MWNVKNKEEKKKEKIDQDFRCHQDNFCKSSTVEEKSVAVKGEILESLGTHVIKELPAFARPIWIRVTKQLQTTGTNKLQKHLLQKDGIDPRAAGQAGDALYWLVDGAYVPFTAKDFKKIEGGGVKL